MPEVFVWSFLTKSAWNLLGFAIISFRSSHDKALSAFFQNPDEIWQGFGKESKRVVISIITHGCLLYKREKVIYVEIEKNET